MENQLTGIGFENVRVFDKPTFLELAPITVFCGANSSGKSTVFKSLLLLSQNAQKEHGLSQLDFTGEGHNLGSLEKTKNNRNDKKEIFFFVRIEEQWIKLEYVEKNNITVLNKVWATNDNFVQSNHSDYKMKDISLCIDLKQLEEQNNQIFIKLKQEEIIREKELEKIKLKLQNFDKQEVDSFIKSLKKHIHTYLFQTKLGQGRELFEYKHNIYKLIHEFFENKKKFTEKGYDSSNAITIYDLFRKLKHSHDFEKYKKLLKKLTEAKIKNLLHLNNYENALDQQRKTIESVLKLQNLHLTYVEAVRINQQRIYTYTPQGTSFNNLLTDIRNKQGNLNPEQIDFINECITELELGETIDLPLNEYVEIKIKRENKDYNLIDVGFGTSQILSMLIGFVSILGQNTDENIQNILIIEEPEAHLHPKLQEKLAALLIKVQKQYAKTILIETHSEYLIHSLQNEEKELVRTYFFENGKIKPIENPVDYSLFVGNFVSQTTSLLHRIADEFKSIGKPTVLCEGITDYKHLTTALLYFQEKGKFNNLELNFYNKEMGGEGQLSKFLEILAFIPLERKVIGIFDHDNQQIIEKEKNNYNDKHYRERKKNLYSFCIPKPDHLTEYPFMKDQFCIEFYYKPEVLYKEVREKDGIFRRLFFRHEFTDYKMTDKTHNRILVYDPQKKEKKNWTDVNDNWKIVDSDVFFDSTKEPVVLSKNHFFEQVVKKADSPIDFSQFEKIFEVIEQIIAEK